ncbi:hypothetical protein ACV0RT_003681, partial [Salmonella enterica]
CRSSITGTGANVGKYLFYVNQLFQKKARLYKLPPICGFNKRNCFFCPRREICYAAHPVENADNRRNHIPHHTAQEITWR